MPVVRVPASQLFGTESPNPPEEEALTNDELRERIQAMGRTAPSHATKAELLEILQAPESEFDGDEDGDSE